MIKLITNFDQYGATFKPIIDGKNTHKTLIGGLTTIILYTLSFTYFIYGFIQW